MFPGMGKTHLQQSVGFGAVNLQSFQLDFSSECVETNPRRSKSDSNLIVWAVRPSHIWSLIPFKSSPTQISIDLFPSSRDVARLIRVFYSEDELTTGITRKKVIVEGRPQ